jgi:hypothetical protein
MRKNIRIGQPATSAKPALRHLDDNDPCLRHAAARRARRYRTVIHGYIVIDSIGSPPPPPPPPPPFYAAASGDAGEDLGC